MVRSAPLDSLPPNSSRSHWALTFNSPKDAVDKALIKIEKISDCFVLVGEEGSQTGLLHWHVYLYKRTGIKARTMRKLVPDANYLDGVRNRDIYLSYLSKNVKDGALIEGSNELVEELKTRAGLKRKDETLIERLTTMVDEGLSFDQIASRSLDVSRRLSFSRSVVRIAETRKYGPGNERSDLKAYYVRTPDTRSFCSLIEKLYGNELFLATDIPFVWSHFQNENTVLFKPPLPGKLYPTSTLNAIERSPTLLPAYPDNKWTSFTTAIFVNSKPIFEAFEFNELTETRLAIASLFTSVEVYDSHTGCLTPDEAWLREVEALKERGFTTHHLPNAGLTLR